MKPCPFCGAPARSDNDHNEPATRFVECTSCNAGIEGPDAYDNWNRRSEAEQRVPDGMVLVPRKQIMGDLNDLQIGDYVEVRYKDGSGKVKGKITKLWVSPHAQAQVNDGWCFHLGDEILVHEPSTDTEERK